MCLAVPMEVIEVTGDSARVSVLGNVREADLTLVGGAEPGEFVLVHAGFAIQKMAREEAEETLNLIRQMGELARDDYER